MPLETLTVNAVAEGAANNGAAASLTFEMPEHSTECFYEIVLRTDAINIEFTVG